MAVLSDTKLKPVPGDLKNKTKQNKSKNINKNKNKKTKKKTEKQNKTHKKRHFPLTCVLTALFPPRNDPQLFQHVQNGCG